MRRFFRQAALVMAGSAVAVLTMTACGVSPSSADGSGKKTEVFSVTERNYNLYEVTVNGRHCIVGYDDYNDHPSGVSCDWSPK